MNNFHKAINILALSLLISGCGGGSTNDPSAPEPVSSDVLLSISGSVGDGPITGATIDMISDGNALLATTVSDQQANYQFELNIQESDFPILLEAHSGIDLVTGSAPDFTLASVILNEATQHANLNPHSTLIVRTAQLMPGGLTQENLQQATDTVLAKLNFGLDSQLVASPISTLIDLNNVVTITHASEALAEMLRRTRQIIGPTTTDEDHILQALAADLTDGLLDGIGTADTNPRYTAVAQVVSLQILLESMLHDLTVNGAPAENTLTAAINTIMGIVGQPIPMDGTTRINPLMLIQTRAALAATQVIESSYTLNNLDQALRALPDDATTSDLLTALEQNTLDVSITDQLEQPISASADASATQIEAIIAAANETDGSDTGTPTENTPPTISGTPGTGIAEGDAYFFTPTASDNDGDSLTFSITNAPAWASFDPTSGTLSGIPDFDDAATYNNITISVSDSTTRVSLPPFGITVTDTNRPPSISGTPAGSIYVGESYHFLPTASDQDSDNQLTFEVENLPAWADFNTETGSISGTPGASDVGLYEDIIVTLSDGTTEVSLPPFIILVDEVPLLTWRLPTTRTDGSALDAGEIGGYLIYVYKEENEFVLSEIVDMNVGDATRYDLSGLEPGTYKFKMSTYDSDGREGPISAESNLKVIL